MSVKKKQLSVDEMEKVTGGARTFESVPNPDGSGWLKVYVNGVLRQHTNMKMKCTWKRSCVHY